MDGRDQGPFVVGAVGTHDSGDRRGRRNPDSEPARVTTAVAAESLADNTAWARLLTAATQDDQLSPGRARALLKQGRAVLETAFLAGTDIEALVAARARLIDRIIGNAWTARIDAADACLVAVGGYGR